MSFALKDKVKDESSLSIFSTAPISFLIIDSLIAIVLKTPLLPHESIPGHVSPDKAYYSSVAT
jgi:hypothetical protein